MTRILRQGHETANPSYTSKLYALKRRSSMIHEFRKFLCWVFALSSLLCLWNAITIIQRIIHLHDASLPLRTLLLAMFFPVLVTIYGTAWWTGWKEKSSGRRWGIAASITYTLLSLWETLHFSRPLLGPIGVMLAIGIIGLAGFLWPGTNP